MNRSDIHELLMLKLTGALQTTELTEIDQLISSEVEVFNTWQTLQDYFLIGDRRKDFENFSTADLMAGLKARMASIPKISFADAFSFYWEKVLVITRKLLFPLDLMPLFTFVHSNILDILRIDKGHLSLDECRSLIARIADNPILMKTISPREFEEVIGELYRNDGFDISFTGKAADGGIDVIVRGESKTGLQRCAIQCKRYRVKKVGVEAVRSLYGVKVHGNFTQAVIVTTSTFTGPAIRFSEERQYELTLKDGRDVRTWCKAYRDKNSE